MALYLLPLFFALMGCSLQKMALRSTTPVMEKSSEGMMEEGSWEFFQASSPANIKFMELLWLQDQENLKLLSLLIKSYSGYAFAVPETLYFEDEIIGIGNSQRRTEAITFYTRSFDYGLQYLKEKDISKADLLSHEESVLQKRLDKLNDEDITAILYTAQSWGSLINLQKDNVVLVSQVPKVKMLFDFVCSRKPDIDNNVCDIFYAQYLSSRPKMLGGNPEEGEKLFLAAMEKHPHNLLIRMSYIQHVVLPGYDEEQYKKQAAILKKELEKWENFKRDQLENLSPYRNDKKLNLFNAIAKKRFLIVEKNKKQIF
ncbi:MAG: TRAP transporter TatT component family protein [Bacteriovoracia bacterium]